MRASRLISLVLLLQARGPWTAAELAERLEVSVRTIERDVDALRAAGVPVSGERGPAGGYRLPGGYRTRLTGLSEDEAEALFLAAPAGDLGLGGFLAEAQLKLLAALPPALRERADRAAGLFHVDHASWFAEAPTPPTLPVLAGALWRGRRARVTHRGRERELDPLGLVLKGSAWYLMADTARGERTFRVDRIDAAEELDAPAARPPGFDLAAAWRRRAREFEEALPLVPVRVRVEPGALRALRSVVDTRRAAGVPAAAADAPAPPLDDGRLELEVWFERLEHAEWGLLSLAGAVEVVAPPELRERMAAAARELAARYGVAGVR